MSSSRQARMIRTAISPRLAISSLRNGGACRPSLCKDGPADGPADGPTAASERDVAMLLSRVDVALRLQELEGPDDPRPRLGRADDVVDVAASRGDVRAR